MAEETTAHYYKVIVDRDVRIVLRDGDAVVSDLFRPDETGPFGVIMTMGPYSKDIHFRDWSRSHDSRVDSKVISGQAFEPDQRSSRKLPTLWFHSAAASQ